MRVCHQSLLSKVGDGVAIKPGVVQCDVVWERYSMWVSKSGGGAVRSPCKVADRAGRGWWSAPNVDGKSSEGAVIEPNNVVESAVWYTQCGPVRAVVVPC